MSNRKKITITIDNPGRDKGKRFILDEMPPRRAEKWAARALLALSRSRIDVTPDMVQGGLAALFTVGLRALSGLQFDEAGPLMDEMIDECVKFMPDNSHPEVYRSLVDDDIDEISTLARLRGELITLHLGFSLPAVLTALISAKATGDGTSNMQTTPELSAG